MAIQKIYFGPPGTGKSYEIDQIVNKNTSIRTVFYPDYSYGDFVGKLTPIIQIVNQVAYEYQLGPFLQALASALSLKSSNKEVYLIIEELNRGNTSSIFGNIFQLLDRSDTGESQYWVSIPKQAFFELIKKIGIPLTDDMLKNINEQIYSELSQKYVDIINSIKDNIEFKTLSIKLPSNLHILCTLNSSDHSIFYLDSAFKRRWEWEFFDLQHGANIANQRKLVPSNINWRIWVDRLNQWLSSHAQTIRMIENKQIGYFFINKKEITEEDIKQKLMFFLWDSVFDRDKSPLFRLLNKQEKEMIHFGDFIKFSKDFIDKIDKFQA